MNSLQKPRKITIIGNDGKSYMFLCKPKDDLRKDCRLMEFNSMINRLLKKDPQSRRRQLRIRTYAVIPLNEECGLIEWVPKTVGFRHILVKLYRSKGIYTSVR
jgi:serine/threonine-protein kinase ATR